MSGTAASSPSAAGPSAGGWRGWASPVTWLDERGRRCPAPVIALGRAAGVHPPGSLLAVLATDPAAAVDVPAWARLRGATYLGDDDPPDGGEGRAHLVRTAAPARTLGVNHVGVSVRDLAAARAFWVDQLGFVDIGGWTWPVGTAPSDAALDLEGTSASVALLRAGSMHLELFEFHAPVPAPRPPDTATTTGLGHVALTVTDVAAVTARLREAGVRVLVDPVGEGGDPATAAAWVSDPDGNLVELLAAAPEAGYGSGGLAVLAHPAPGPDDPGPTSLTRDDVLGVHHVAIGVAGPPGSGARRWATCIDAAGGQPVRWPPRDLPPDVTGGAALAAGCRAAVLLEAGNVRLEVVEADAASPRGTCDLGYNHVCLDVEGIADWPERLTPGQLRWHHQVVESSGGIAAVRYGREEGGIVVELLENRSSRAVLWCGHLPGLVAR